MITNASHLLIFGTLDLLGTPNTDPGWWAEASGVDASLGSPIPVVRAVTSFLMDGAIEVTERHDNRELTFKVTLTGTTSANLAAAEQALFFEVGKRNYLTWIPPDEIGDYPAEPSIFQVVNSSLDFSFDDITELHLKRTYTLSIKALPFAYGGGGGYGSTDPPPTTTPVNTLVDACSSLTGWAATAEASGFGSVDIATSGGVITGSQGFPHGTGTKWVTLTRTGLSVSMTGTPNVRIKFNSTTNVTATILASEVRLNGTVVAASARDGDYAWYPFAGATLTSVSIKSSAKFPSVNGTLFLNVDEIYRTDSTTLKTVAGQRQLYNSFDIEGTARTQASIYVGTVGSTALGSTLVHTNRGDITFQPDLRRWLAAGPTETTDTALVSQKSSPLTTTHYFNLPPEVPSAGYLLMARVKHASAGTYTLNWGADMTPTSTPTTPVTSIPAISGSQSVTLQAATWEIVPVAKLVLPLARSGVEITPRVSLSSASAVSLDEAWLFDVDNGRLTHVECGTGTPTAAGPFDRMYLLSADLVNPQPAVMLYGTSSDDVGVFAGQLMRSFGAHEFTPPNINIFTVTTGSVETTVQMEYLAAWHTHVVPSA